MSPGKVNYHCEVCDKTFPRKSSLIQHQRTSHGTESYQCQQCRVHFTRRDSYTRHMNKHHQHQINQVGRGQEDPMDTDQSTATVSSVDQIENARNQLNEEESDCISTEEAINGNIKKISLSAEDQTKYDPLSFLKAKEEKVRLILKEEIKKRLRIKFYLTLQIRFTKTKGEQIEMMEPFFHGRCHIILKSEDIDEAMRESMKKMFTSFLEFQREGSNWTVDKVLRINIHIVKYKPLKGSSYIPLPTRLGAKKAIVNVQNTDNKCFMWSVLAARHPSNGHHSHPNRVSNYSSYHDELDFTNIQFPVRIQDVPKFEKKNNISINVFGYEKQEIYPIHLTKERGLRHVDLLVISNGEKSHYCWIRNFDRLMGSENNDNNRYFYCHYCLHGLTKRSLLDRHLPDCQVHGAQRIEMPLDEDKWLRFTDVSKQMRVPFVVYADFECMLERIYGCQPNPKHSSTIRLAKHIPSGFTYKVVGITEDLTEDHVTYRGPDAANVFVDHMIELEERLLNALRDQKPMDMTETDISNFHTATDCSICGKPLNSDRVRDHCHVTGKIQRRCT